MERLSGSFMQANASAGSSIDARLAAHSVRENELTAARGGERRQGVNTEGAQREEMSAARPLEGKIAIVTGECCGAIGEEAGREAR